MPSVGVVIAAGGRGRRLGGTTPKQFLLLDGIPILQRTTELFASLRSVGEIVVTSPRDCLRRVERLLAGIACGKLVSIVPGGKERQDSVWRGLQGFLLRPDIVLVHDAVRPFVSRQTIEEVILAATKYGAAVTGVRIQDTVKMEGEKGYYSGTIDRSKLWAVQTPQGFAYDLLLRGHRKARSRGYVGTDEASLVERLGIPVRIVEGDPMNIKITTPQDLRLAKMWLKEAGNPRLRT